MRSTWISEASNMDARQSHRPGGSLCITPKVLSNWTRMCPLRRNCLFLSTKRVDPKTATRDRDPIGMDNLVERAASRSIPAFLSEELREKILIIGVRKLVVGFRTFPSLPFLSMASRNWPQPRCQEKTARLQMQIMACDHDRAGTLHQPRARSRPDGDRTSSRAEPWLWSIHTTDCTRNETQRSKIFFWHPIGSMSPCDQTCFYEFDYACYWWWCAFKSDWECQDETSVRRSACVSLSWCIVFVHIGFCFDWNDL